MSEKKRKKRLCFSAFTKEKPEGNCVCILSQHALRDRTIKLGCNSFEILLSAGYGSFEAVDAVSSLPSKSKLQVRRHQTLAKTSVQASPLNCCAYAIGCTETLLTEQALPLSEESMIRQQASAFSCGSALVALLKEVDTTGASCLVLPRTSTKKSHSFPCLLRAAQLPSWGSAFTATALVPSPTTHPRASAVFDSGEPEQKKVCWSNCCTGSRCRAN